MSSGPSNRGILCPDMRALARMMAPGSRVCVALGIFDGVHVGHRRILAALSELAAETESVPVVLTFEPHPRELFTGEPPLLLTTRDQKLELFEACGVSHVIIMRFTRELAGTPADAFLRQVFLESGLEVTGCCVGSNFRFGAGNEGSAGSLDAWMRRNGKQCRVMPSVEYDGAPISSSRIRQAVLAGEMEQAAAMLGRRYSVRGVVQHGYGIGSRELSCPTANLREPGHPMPPEGVYAAYATLESALPCVECPPPASKEARYLKGIVYVGTAPTIKADGEVVIELHLFDVNEDFYGKEIEVTFLDFIRESRRFDSRDALMAQIEKDIAAARIILDNDERA